jgi:hypothetical protein
LTQNQFRRKTSAEVFKTGSLIAADYPIVAQSPYCGTEESGIIKHLSRPMNVGVTATKRCKDNYNYKTEKASEFFYSSE